MGPSDGMQPVAKPPLAEHILSMSYSRTDPERRALLWQCRAVHSPAGTATRTAQEQVGAPRFGAFVHLDFHRDSDQR